VRAVQLHIGNATHSVLVFGRRWWRRGLRGVSATEPEAIGELALSWKHAYGGSFDLPAGYFPGPELPWPGGRLFYPLNPEGTGFYPTEDAAIDQPLPSIENPSARVAAPSDAPTPAGVAPCPDLHALKLMGNAESLTRTGFDGVRAQFDAAIRSLHHAPAPLIVERVPPGTTVSIAGLGGEPFGFVVSTPPLSVTFERSRRDRRTAMPHVRSVHLDAEAGRVRAVWGYTHTYHPDRAPRRVDVQERLA
jgi:hypothetical protein